MKKIFFSLLFMLISITTFAAAPADTIAVDNTKIENVIEHATKTSKGNPTTKYYFIYNKELIPTSKTVVDKYRLAKQYKANCALAIVKRGSNKRIILN